MSPSAQRWIGWSRAVLVFVAVSYVFLGIAMVPLFPLMSQEDGSNLPRAFTLGLGLFMLLVCLGIAGVNLLAAWGLGGRKKWAWILTLILGGMYAPTACLPFGVVLLYAMLHKEGREAFDA